MDWLKIKKNSEIVEPVAPRSQFEMPTNILIEIDGVKIGAIQEFVITEFKNQKYVQLDISRLMCIKDKLSDIFISNDDNQERFNITLTETYDDGQVAYRFNDTEISRYSRRYTAENFILLEDISLVSYYYFKEETNA